MDRLVLGMLAIVALGSPIFADDEPASAAVEAQRRLLETADERGPNAVSEARKRFDSARALAEDDRLARYAYGIVLVRLHKAKDAATEFQAAAVSEMGVYPPALRAAMYLLLSGRDSQAASTLARQLADALVNAPDAWDTDAAWSADARWLGEAVSAAQLLVTTADDVKLWSDVDQELRAALPNDLRTEYAAGFESVIERQTALQTKAEEVRQDAIAAEGEKNELIRKEVKSARQQIAAQKENLKAAAGDWKKLFDDQMTQFAKELGKLEKEWTALDNRRQSLERSILIAQQEIALMQQQLQNFDSQNNRSNRVGTFDFNLRQTLNVQLGQRQAALFQYQFDWNRTAGSQQQVQQQAVGLLSQRQAAIADYQQRTGELIEQDGQLTKWNKRLNEKAAELDEPLTGQSPKTRALQQKLKTIGAYLPWDWEAERQRLLNEAKSADDAT